MNKAPAFQFYPTDLLTDENFALMSLEARGAYITLICYCWREGSIPADMNRMGRLCGIDGSAMAQLWQELCHSFSASHDRYVNTWLERIRLRQIEHSKERQESGKKGAQSRWEKVQNAQSVPVEGLNTNGSANSSANGSAIAELDRQPMANDASSSSSSSSSSDISTKKRTRKTRKPTTVDDQYIDELQRNPAYSHLNVKGQFYRMSAWCEPRNLEPTRLRFLAWLNREPGPPKEAAPPAGDEWARREIAATFEDLPAQWRHIGLDATEVQKANVLANYNRRVREARGEVTA